MGFLPKFFFSNINENIFCKTDSNVKIIFAFFFFKKKPIIFCAPVFTAHCAESYPFQVQH